MRRVGLLIAGVFLATGAGVAFAAPASAATGTGGHHPDCGDYHYGHYDHQYRHHRWHMWNRGGGNGPWTDISG